MDYVPASELRVIDGYTFRAGSERILLENIDAPETGNLARCDAERFLSNSRASACVRSSPAGR